MRIALDASRSTVARVTGTEHYSRELTRALIALDCGHEFDLYFRDPPPPDLYPAATRVRQQVIPMQRAWTHLRFAAAVTTSRPDVIFVPAHTLPFVFLGRAVVTVHDLGFRYFPETHTRMDRFYLDLTTGYSAQRARLVLADSEATAQDLAHIYRVAPEKIRVVYPGVDPLPVGSIDTVRAKYKLPERYFLFLGTLQPRKNIAVIVQAYQRWRQTNPEDQDIGLVLAGKQGWLYNEHWARGMPGVQMTGYVDDEDKGALYAGALALVFPSLYEGFGFPVIEAMHCGLPVITSSTSSLPELAGEAALLVDPLNVDGITQHMTQISANVELRALLREKGYKQAAGFTWEKAAAQVMAALEVAAGGGGRQ